MLLPNYYCHVCGVRLSQSLATGASQVHPAEDQEEAHGRYMLPALWRRMRYRKYIYINKGNQ